MEAHPGIPTGTDLQEALHPVHLHVDLIRAAPAHRHHLRQEAEGIAAVAVDIAVAVLRQAVPAEVEWVAADANDT